MLFFTTARLAARRFVPEDLDSLDRMQGNPRVMMFITGMPRTRDETAAELERIISGYGRPEDGFLVMAVERKSDSLFIGSCAVISGEIGFRLDEPYWGQGYGKEIFDGLVEYCFSGMGLGSIRAEAEDGNAASVRILESQMLFCCTNTDEQTGNRVRCYQMTNPYG